MKILLTGATGLVGRALSAQLLKDGHELHILSRKKNPEINSAFNSGIQSALRSTTHSFQWSGREPVPPEALIGVEAIIHLAGENIGQWPWTADRKQRILASRVEGTRNLVESFKSMPVKPKVFVSASALGIYGNSPVTLCKEGEERRGEGFLAEVVRAWETEIFAAEKLGIRTVAIRSGIILSLAHKKNDPKSALDKMILPFRFGMGATIGSGNQPMPWIHLHDTVGIFIHALKTESLKGPVNACSSGIKSNREFSKILAKSLHRPCFLNLPEFFVKLIFGGMAETVLFGQNADTTKLKDSGYRFQYSDLILALERVLVPPIQ